MTACGGSKQTPDELNNLKKGTEEEGNNLPVEDRFALEIDTDAYYKFSEGEDVEVKVYARSMYPKSVFELELLNPQDFPKIQISSEEGNEGLDKKAILTMKWKVPQGFAKKNNGGEPDLYFSFAVATKGYLTKGIPNDRRVTKDVMVILASTSKNVPSITKVVPVTGVKEGTNASLIKVHVTDVDGQPELIILPNTKNNYAINGASYLQPQTPVQDPATPNGWIFDVKVDLANVEITQSSGTAYYDIAAYSSGSGNISSIVTGNFTIWTSISQPVNTWTKEVNFKVNSPNIYTFTVTDPKGEGQISAAFASSCAGIAGSPQCSCKSILGISGKSGGAAQCTISWFPPANLAGSEQSFSFNFSNKSAIPGDTDVKTVQFTGKIKLN